MFSAGTGLPVSLRACVAAAVALGPCVGSAQQDAAPPIRLTDVTSQTGIAFRHHTGGSGEGYIVEGMTAGLALFDYDSDGLVDIYFLNGAPLKGTVIDPPPRNALYRNNGDWTFTDVTDEAGVGDTRHSLGVAVADYDGDGRPDIYVNNFGRNTLYRNNGDRTFTDVTDRAGVGNGEQVGAGACFFDIDGDRDLDLYVGNYVDFTYENHVPIVIDGRRFQAGPQYYKPVPDTLYRNDGDGTFTDVSEASGVAALAGPSMGMVAFDYDEDGDLDLFIAHDGRPNFLLENDGKGRFRENAMPAGVACNFYGKATSSMGVDCGDYDNDGRLDLFVTTYQGEMPILFRNLGGGLFEDATSAARVTTDLFPHVNWGTGFVDLDNDGRRDLFLANGHFDRIELIDDRTALRIPNSVLRNDGGGRFADVSKSAGDGLAVVESSRGAAFDDLDNDGDIDAVVLNADAPPTILRNDSATGHHWVQVQLEAATPDTAAIGARVTCVAGDSAQSAAVHAGRSYQSHFGTRLHFGLGTREKVDRVEVRWPDGATESFPGGEADRLLVLKQGTSGAGRD